MTRAADTDDCPLAAVRDSSISHRYDRYDRQRVCEIVAQIAAEVLSEVQSGTWHPPMTFRASLRRGNARTGQGPGPDRVPLFVLGVGPARDGRHDG